MTRRAAPAVPQGPSKEELQRQEDARFEREEQERQEANARAEAKHAAELAAVEKQQAAIAKAEAGAARAAQVHAARPKFIMAEASLDRAANTFDKSALTFKEGDMIHVKKQNENGLWEGSVVDGRRKGKRGHFPFTFVELVASGDYNDDIKAIEKEFKIAELKKAGIDINNLLKMGQKLPPIAAVSTRTALPPVVSSCLSITRSPSYCSCPCSSTYACSASARLSRMLRRIRGEGAPRPQSHPGAPSLLFQAAVRPPHCHRRGPPEAQRRRSRRPPGKRFTTTVTTRRCMARSMRTTFTAAQPSSLTMISLMR